MKKLPPKVTPIDPADCVSVRGKLVLALDPESRWRNAIADWLSGNGSSVDGLLRSASPIPPFARDWLADALAGSIKRRRGPKAGGRAAGGSYRAGLAAVILELRINEEYQVERSRFEALKWNAAQAGDDSGLPGTPSDEAIALVAQRHGLKDDAVSKIVHPRKRKSKRSNEVKAPISGK